MINPENIKPYFHLLFLIFQIPSSDWGNQNLLPKIYFPTKCGSKLEDYGALEIYKFIKTSWFYKYQIYKYLMKHRHLSSLRRSWIYFSKKNMVCIVQIPQQSYWKVFQNNMFILFCTRIYMEMNNLRVGELRDQWLRCYILNQKDSGSDPTSRT